MPPGAAQARPYRTQGVPGLGGIIKQRPEDFLVDELPLYPPSGEGEHLMFLVEKRGMSTLHMARLLAAHFAVAHQAVGYAGLKDKHAITRQHVTVHVPGKRLEDFPALNHPSLTILWADYHNAKLRRGHLAGNGFSIRIRGVKPQQALHAHKALAVLARRGVANFVGGQRFGAWGVNHRIGLALVLGEADRACDLLLGPLDHAPDDQSRSLYAQGRYADALEALPRSARAEARVLAGLARGAPPDRAIWKMGKTELGFMGSALQSWAFNAVLAARMEDGGLDELRPGDVAWVHGARSTTFLVPDDDDADDLRRRLAALEISPTGPLWGPSMRRAGGPTDQAERDALASCGLTPEAVDAFARAHRGVLEGARRPLRVPLASPDVEGGVDEHGPFVRCGFELPRGAYATEVLAEVMKPEGPLDPGPAGADA